MSEERSRAMRYLETGVPADRRDGWMIFGYQIGELSREELELAFAYVCLELERSHDRFSDAMDAWRMFRETDPRRLLR